MKQLEKGKLYQVRYEGNWIIAEYIRKTEAREAHGHIFNVGTGDLGVKQVWQEPAAHWLHQIPGREFVTINDKDFQVRPVTPATLAEIERLKNEIKRLGEQQEAVRKELKELCG